MPNVNILLASGVCKTVKQENYDGISASFVSPNVKGDGQLRLGNGLHTVSISLHSFVGTIYIQGTLKIDPDENDWVNIWLQSPNVLNNTQQDSLEYLTPITRADIYIFYGKFIWVRAKANPYTSGSIDHIRLTI